MIQKSYDEKPKLYIIPTPIGNMDDMTFRSISTLKTVDIVFAEDTRVTGLLLNHFKIKKQIISNYKYNEKKNILKLQNLFIENKSIALLSDRGTPCISDPGNIIVSEGIKIGYNVICLPGATAFVPALIMSGLLNDKFMFIGFLNNKKNKRRKELEELKNIKVTLIFYESPHRLQDTLNDMYDIFNDRKISICREISKKYEEINRTNLKETIQLEKIKGEYVLIVEGNLKQENNNKLTVKEHLDLYIKKGYTSNDAIKTVAKERKVAKNEIYKVFHN